MRLILLTVLFIITSCSSEVVKNLPENDKLWMLFFGVVFVFIYTYSIIRWITGVIRNFKNKGEWEIKEED